ncbi:WD40/YVTN/BNR-like repeat-containing protein [Nonlabens sp. Asnod2-A12]|uniref:WD40/YVTN/BNR-like repeat-containing protein n=1 Tax=Nonlabens sp. Asnod2-A12 TaxID=3160578 RepID=UPI00386DC50E
MKRILLLALCLLSIQAFAQKLDLDLVKNLEPRNIGPGGMSGRVTSIDVVHENPENIFAGTASGGLWNSQNGGITWKPIFENEATASVGAVAVQQSNPSVIWVGTGEGNPRNSLNGGAGIYKSLDGGHSWTLMGLEKTRNIHRVIIDPTNPDIVYAAAIGSPWGVHPERGVFKTTDGGKTWKKILYTNDKSGAADLVMDPTNPNKLIAAMWEHKRDPWFFKSGGEGSGMYITHDGGDNWKKITSEEGLPKGELGRIGVAIAPSDPSVVYALVEAKKNALYKSTDGGFKWKMINNKSDIGNRPFYYSEIYVDSQNENRLYSVFTYINVSEDGGKSFTQLMPAYGVDNGVHPDHHAWYIHPKNGKFMIDGNDGGLNITRDRGKTWRFIGNLPVAQFYHINVDMETPYNVYGGMQDNGSWRGPAYSWRAQSIRNSYWQEISFGDGFDVVPDPDNSRYGYSMSQQGSVQRYDWQTGNNYSVKPTHPDASVKLRFNWNSAINIDPFDNSTLYFGSQFVHKSTDKGLTWQVISPDLTTNDPEKQKQSESGGLTMDATGAENHTTILVIEPSAVEKDVLYAASDDGLVHITKNGGDSWDNITSGLRGLPKGSWITQIKASQTKKGHALLVANDYRRFNFEPYAYRTTNYGKSWTRIVDKDDVISYALCIIEHPEENNLLFLGTDDGLYVSIDAGDNWTKYTNGFPTVSVKDLVIHPREDDLIIGTFGRAAWVLDDLAPFTAFAKARPTQSIALYEPPTAYFARYQQPTGSRFGADAMFRGENRSRPIGQFKYFFDKDLKAKSDTTKTDSLFLKIYKGEELIRTLNRKVPKEKGIHNWSWRLDEKGAKSPSRGVNDSKREPSGNSVLPGTYKAVLHYGDLTSETMIEVKEDPRIDEFTLANRKEMRAAQDQLQTLMSDIEQVTSQLAKNKKTADSFKKLLKSQDKKAFKEQIKTTDSIVKQIEKLQNKYFGTPDKRQGITRNPEVTVLNRVRSASGYIRSRQGAQTATEKQLYQQAETLAKEVNIEAQNFLNKEWKAFVSEMKLVTVDMFEE